MALADVPLKTLQETVIPYEQDEITRLIIDSHNKEVLHWSAALPQVNCATGYWVMQLLLPMLPNTGTGFNAGNGGRCFQTDA